MPVVVYILLILGLFEIISNLIHLSKKTIDAIGKSAKKQHQEIPLSLPYAHFYYKAIIMFTFGVLFIIAVILSILHVEAAPGIIWIVSILFGLYGLIQALIYRKEIKVWPAMIVYNIPLLVNIFVK